MRRQWTYLRWQQCWDHSVHADNPPPPRLPLQVIAQTAGANVAVDKSHAGRRAADLGQQQSMGKKDLAHHGMGERRTSLVPFIRLLGLLSPYAHAKAACLLVAAFLRSGPQPQVYEVAEGN